MFWVALSVLVMSMTGLGDDTRFFLQFLASLEEAAQSEVKDQERVQEVMRVAAETRVAFRQTRETFGSVGDCFEQLDRDFRATEADYTSCGRADEDALYQAGEALIEARRKFHAVTTPEERARIRERVLAAAK